MNRRSFLACSVALLPLPGAASAVKVCEFTNDGIKWEPGFGRPSVPPPLPADLGWQYRREIRRAIERGYVTYLVEHGKLAL